MQEQTITLTQYWQQMKDKMQGFLDSHPDLSKEHPAKKAAEAVIGMALVGETLEGMSAAGLVWNGLSIRSKMLAFSAQIGMQNDNTKNYIPIKSDDPVHKDFAKVYLLGLKNILKVKVSGASPTSSSLITNGSPKFGDPGIAGAQKLVPDDIAAIEANYPELREDVSVTDEKASRREDESSSPVSDVVVDITITDVKSTVSETKSSVPSAVPNSVNDPKIQVLVGKYTGIAGKLEEKLVKATNLEAEITQLVEEIANLNVQIESFSWLGKIIDGWFGILGMSVQVKYQEKQAELRTKKSAYSEIADSDSLMSAQKRIVGSYLKQAQKLENPPAPVVVEEQKRVPLPVIDVNQEILDGVIAEVANEGWDQLEDDGSREDAIAIIKHSLVIAKPAYGNKEAVIEAIADKVQSAIYPKTFNSNTGMYLESRGYTSRFFGMACSGETLTQASLVKAIQQVTANAPVATVLAQQSVSITA